MTERRAFLSKLALSGIALAGAGRVQAQPAAAQNPALHAGEAGVRDVRAFGARGDGITDDTAAFNAATSAAASVTEQGSRIGIFVPPGTYRIDGTIFLHKGQSLAGAGDASVIDASRARGRTIVMGRDGRDREDPGGAPATLGELRFWGGSDRAPLIHAPLAGFVVRNLFITSPGIAIEICGGEGIVSNVIIDQALNGIILRGARNVLIDNVITYAVNYAVTIDTATNDVALSNMILAYTKYASILFAEGASGISSIRVSGVTFVSNIEYSSFVGHVHARAQVLDAQFSDCVFRNWRGFAVTQEAGSGARLIFANCTFDGSRSHASYNASSTASGVRTGDAARFRFTDCRFLHMSGPVASIGPGLQALTFDGGLVEECRGNPIRFTGPGDWAIGVRGMEGFGRRIEQDGVSGIVLPWSGGATAWRVAARRCGSAGGVTLGTVAVCAAGNNVVCSIGGEQRHGAPLALGCGLGDRPGGPVQAPLGAGHGSLCVTVPATGVDWAAETAI